MERLRLGEGRESFHGRDHELAEIAAAIRRHRLVTLTGAGGIGKTRLASEAALRSHGEFTDGARVADLSAVGDANLVATTVAAATGTYDASCYGDELLGHVAIELAEQDLLLVLDNCEHVLAAVRGLVERLVHTCDRLRVLATSRVALGVVGERCLVVGPLAEGASDLFVDRATAAGTVIDLGRDAAAIRSICRRLDDMPLALELAAARSRHLPLVELDQRLDDALPMLRRSRRDDIDRHATMEATLDWSHERLAPAAQILFRRLSVFSGGWTADAATAVCTGAPLTDPVLDVLGDLVDASMVIVDRSADRFRLLEPVRQYAMRMLASSSEYRTTVTAHRSFFEGEARSIDRRVLKTGVTASDLAELPNHRVAIRRALDRGDHADALRATVNLGWCWVAIGGHLECVDWLAPALDEPGDTSDRLRLVAECMAAGYLAYGGRAGRASSHVERAFTLLDRVPDAPGARYLLSTALECLGRSPLEQFEEAECSSIAAGNLALAAYVARARARWYCLQWRFEAAHEALDRAMALARTGDVAFARQIELQRLAVGALAGETIPSAVVRHLCDTPPSAHALAFESEDRAIVVAIGAPPHVAAPIVAAEAIRSARAGFLQRTLVQLRSAAVLRARVDRGDLAAVLAAAVDEERRRCGYARLPLLEEFGRAVLDDAVDRIGPDARSQAHHRGRSMSLSEALELAATPVLASTAGPLSPRETQVLSLVADGLENQEIAQRLHISPRTVDAHLSHIRSKLGISSRTGLARWAFHRGLFPREPRAAAAGEAT